MRGGFGVAIFLLLDIENLHSQGGKASGMHVSESSGRCRGSAGWTKKGGMRERGKGNSLPDAVRNLLPLVGVRLPFSFGVGHGETIREEAMNDMAVVVEVLDHLMMELIYGEEVVIGINVERGTLCCRITVSSSQIASRLPELTMRLSDAILEPL
jgi:hypothetical protein